MGERWEEKCLRGEAAPTCWGYDCWNRKKEGPSHVLEMDLQFKFITHLTWGCLLEYGVHLLYNSGFKYWKFPPSIAGNCPIETWTPRMGEQSTLACSRLTSILASSCFELPTSTAPTSLVPLLEPRTQWSKPSSSARHWPVIGKKKKTDPLLCPGGGCLKVIWGRPFLQNRTRSQKASSAVIGCIFWG